MNMKTSQGHVIFLNVTIVQKYSSLTHMHATFKECTCIYLFLFYYEEKAISDMVALGLKQMFVSRIGHKITTH